MNFSPRKIHLDGTVRKTKHSNKSRQSYLNQPILVLYVVNADMKISVDGSSYGLGAVLLQRESQSWQPVIYASRAMTSTESRYAQAEKETLATA